MNYNVKINTGKKGADEYLEYLGYKEVVTKLIRKADKKEKRALGLTTKSEIIITDAEPSKYIYLTIDGRNACIKYWIVDQTEKEWEGCCSFFEVERLETDEDNWELWCDDNSFQFLIMDSYFKANYGI